MIVTIQRDVEAADLDGRSSNSAIRRAIRRANGTPRVRMPTRTTLDAAVLLDDLVGHAREARRISSADISERPARVGWSLTPPSPDRTEKTPALRGGWRHRRAYMAVSRNHGGLLAASRDRLKGGGLVVAARAHEEYGTPAPPEQETNDARCAALAPGSSDPLRSGLQSAQWGHARGGPDLDRRPRPAYAVTVSEVLRLALPSGRRWWPGRAAWAVGSSGRLLGARQGLLSGSEAGEMVLLPASAVRRGFSRVVRDLGMAGVEAVLVTTMPPADAVEAADELGMPILRIGAQSSLIEVERAIISLIVDKESQVRRRVEQIYERLLATLVDDAGIQALAAEVADVARRPTIVLDEYFRVQVTVPDDEATQQIGQEVGATLAAGDPALGARPAAPFWLASENDSPRALVVPLRCAAPATWCWAARGRHRPRSTGGRAGGCSGSSWRSSAP